MAKLWQQIKNLFQEASQSSPSNPAVHEVIVRDEVQLADYETWKNTLVKRRLVDWLNDQHAIFKVLPDDIDEALDFLDTPSSKGFVIHFYKTRYTKREATYFFDYLKEQVRNLGYRLQVGDIRTYNRPNWVETVERYYLKPPPDFQSKEKFNQRFGNITIELLLKNDAVFNLRFRATTYNDHLFKEADEFHDLMQMVLA